MKKLLLLFGFVMHSLGSQLETDNNNKNGDRTGSSESHPGFGRDVRKELRTPDGIRANVDDGVPETPDTPKDTPTGAFREPMSSPENTLNDIQSIKGFSPAVLSSRPNSAGNPLDGGQPQPIPEDRLLEMNADPFDATFSQDKGQLPGSPNTNRLLRMGFGYRDPEAGSDVSEAASASTTASTTASTADSAVSAQPIQSGQSNHGKG